MKKLKRLIENSYMFLLFLFFYVPIVILMVLSFNSSKSRGHWGGFSLQWYGEMFADAM